MIKGKYRTEIVNEALADKAAYLCDSAKTTTASRKNISMWLCTARTIRKILRRPAECLSETTEHIFKYVT